MRIIAIANQKGGVGKTTTAVNLSYALAERGRRTLLLDLDPQAHATYSLGVSVGELERPVYDVLHGEATLRETILERGQMQLIPSTLDLSAAELEFAGVPGRESIIKDALKSLRNFDYCLIDCPPSLGFLTLNALAAAKEAYITVQAEGLALRGLAKLTDTIELVRKRLNRALRITGVIIVRYDGRKVLNREVAEEIRRYFREAVFKTQIRENIAIAEAPLRGQTIFEYAPRSHGAEDYAALAEEVIGRE